MLRRPLLSIFSTGDHFGLVAAVPVAFAFHDTPCPIDELVCPTDAFTGKGEDSISRHGGYGVTSRHFEPGEVLDAARRDVDMTSLWRGHVGVRDSAFSDSSTQQGEQHVRYVRTLERPAGRSGFDHARGKLQLTLCDNLALTLTSAQGRSSSARFNTACRE